MLLIIGLLAFPQLIKAWKYDPHAPENQAYYTISAKQRFEYVAMYLGLAGYLAYMAHETHEMLRAAAP
jgi:hypothetical protein